MAKGYWIVRVDISDPQPTGTMSRPTPSRSPRLAARFLVRGGKSRRRRRGARPQRGVEFPSFEAARDCYDDAAYQAAKELRDGGERRDFLIIEGYDGPQPGD